jgi:hypothetical protein
MEPYPGVVNVQCSRLRKEGSNGVRVKGQSEKERRGLVLESVHLFPECFVP